MGSDIDRVALAALDDLADVLAAEAGDTTPARRPPRSRSALSRAVDVDVDVAATCQLLGQRRRDAETFLTAASICVAILSIVARSAPAILTPTGLLMPVASMSMRLRIGGTQMFDSPGPSYAVQLLDELVGRHARHATARAA